MSPSTDVVGPRPLTFTDVHGAQRSLPLAGLELVGSKVQVKSAWQGAFAASDLPLISALATAKYASGEVTPPPVAPPTPAVVFRAAVAGPEGNGISVTVATKAATPASTVFNATLSVGVTETDTYAGLSSAVDAFQQIGTDTAPSGPTDPPEGTGLVQVVATGTPGAGLPKDGQSLPVKAKAVDVVATDGSTVLFSLGARAGYSGKDLTVGVTLDPGGTTFTVTATYAPAATVDVPLDNLTTLPAPLPFVIAATAPSGLGLPPETTATVALTGGAPGAAASGVAFTA